MRKFVLIYLMPTIKELEKVIDNNKEVSKEIIFIPIFEHNAFIVGLESERDSVPSVPNVHLIFKQKVLIFDYDDYMKMVDNPDHIPTPLLPDESIEE